MQYVKVTEAESLITIGRQGEYGVRTICFPDYGYETAKALVKRQGDSGYYEVDLTHNVEVFQWAVGAYDVGMVGYGKIQVKYYTNSECLKTVIWDTRTHKSIDATDVPSSYTSGDAIFVDSTDRSINVLFDSDTLSLNDANELVVLPDSSKQDKLTFGTGLTLTDSTLTANIVTDIGSTSTTDAASIYCATLLNRDKQRKLVPSGAITVDDNEISVKVDGTTIKINNQDKLQANYAAGSGISITGNSVAASVDGTTITTNASGQLTLAVSTLQDSETF